ncbi:hypothetical protein HDU76_001632 [Blyttiomyces sp. JEL0837]|nr:hypothetical protein HDU76_001632 [Blyttiomyces sp. JEL0837]
MSTSNFEAVDGGPPVNWDNFKKVTVQSLSGEKVTLRSLAEQGRTCFVFLRRFDCATCYTYLVLFAHLRPALSASNIRIVFISCHQDLSEVQLFLKGFAFWLRELASHNDYNDQNSCRVTGSLKTSGALPGEIYLDGARESYKVFGLYEEIDKPQGVWLLAKLVVLDWLGYSHIGKPPHLQKRLKSKNKIGIMTEARQFAHDAFKNQIDTPPIGSILQSPGIVVVENNTLLYRYIVRDQVNTIPDGSDANLLAALACEAHPERLQNLDEKVVKGVELFLDTVYDAANTARVQNSEFVLTQRLGQGRESEVFKSSWAGVDVAVKYFRYRPPPDRSSESGDSNATQGSKLKTEEEEENEDNLSSFANEAALLMSLRHRNIITMMGFGSKPPHHFVITEFMPRGSLFDVLGDFKRYPSINSELKYSILMDTAKGMAFLHSCNPQIVHQDLKSLNLLVADNWTVKISDFGIAREVAPRPKKESNVNESTSDGGGHEENESGKPAHGGTLQWMAPELLLGNHKPTTKMDIFAFGIICWEVATRRRPWKSIQPKVITQNVIMGKRPPVSPEDSWNRDFQLLVSACWAQNPADRPEFSKIVKALSKVVIPSIS